MSQKFCCIYNQIITKCFCHFMREMSEKAKLIEKFHFSLLPFLCVILALKISLFGHFPIENGLRYNIWLRPRFGSGWGPSSVPAEISCRTVRKYSASKIVFGNSAHSSEFQTARCTSCTCSAFSDFLGHRGQDRLIDSFLEIL